MNKTKKLAIFISSLVLALAIIFLVTKIFFNNSYRNQIPAIPDFASLPAPVKEQLSLAHQKAYDSPTTDNIGMLGMTYHSCAYYNQAIQCYKIATTKDKSKWIWNYYLGYLNQEMSDSRAAIENFNSVIKENPKALMVWYYLGKAYQNSGSGDMAEAAFKKIADLPNENSNVRSIRVNYSSLPTGAKFELARIYLNTNRLDEAEKILKDVVKVNKTIGPVYRLLGNVYRAKGDSALSKKYIVRAKDLAEGTTINDTLIDRIALMSRSELYLPKQIDEANKTNNPEWALKLFDQALLYLPDNKYLISKAIKFFLQMNTPKKALPYLDINFNNFKDNYNEMSNVANLLYIKGFYSQAIPYYSQSIKLKPDSYELLENFALCCWKAGKKDSALILMSELYANNKINPIVLAIEVDFMLKLGDKEKAKSYLTKFRQIAPSDPKILKLSGIITEIEGNQNAAIQMYEAAFKGDPTDLETTQKLGDFFIEQRLWSKAISLFRSSLEYHPNESMLQEKLGTLLISCPDLKLQSIEEGLELSERAYFHISCTSTTLLSAAKNLALGNAMLGNFQTATSYMLITLNIAKSEKVSQDYMDMLLLLASEIKQSSKKQ